MTVAALCAYPLDAELSARMLNHLRGPRPLSNMDLSFIKDRFRDKDYVPRSYFNGSTPENNYTPQKPYTVTVSENPYSYQNEGYATLYIRSGGADSPRQVQLRLAKDGKWYFQVKRFILRGVGSTCRTNLAFGFQNLDAFGNEEIDNLNIWEGDKIFFRLLEQEVPFFSLKLCYDGDRLVSHHVHKYP